MSRFVTKLGRRVSKIAFGTARLGERRIVSTPSNQQEEDVPSIPALKHAIQTGINVFDTSTIYGKEGASEIEIGKIIQSIDRNDLVLISKCGYRVDAPIVQDESDSSSSSSSSSSSDELDFNPDLDHLGLIPVGDNVSACFHPTFIRTELTQSLERLQVQSLEAYLLHNPEHYLEHHLPLNGTLDTKSIAKRREQFLQDVILPAFVALEQEVQEGRIQSYGISSKSFNHGQTHPHYFDPKDLIQLAVQAVETIKSSTNNDSLQHSFDIVQFPMNPIEAYGIDVVHDLRNTHNMHVMLNRPLSPTDRNGVWRLVDGVGRQTSDTETKTVVETEAETETKTKQEATLSSTTTSFGSLLAGWESIPAVVSMRNAREAAFVHFTPPKPMNPNQPTADEMEVIEACIFLCSLIRDLDHEIDKFTSFQHYEQNIMEGIVPVIHEKIEGMDEDSTQILMSFFEEYGKAVRQVVPYMTREKIQSILNPLNKKQDDMGGGLHLLERPHEIQKNISLEEYSLKWIDQIECGNVVVGMTAIEHVDFALKHLKNE